MDVYTEHKLELKLLFFILSRKRLRQKHSSLKKNSIFLPSPLYNEKFYFYIWAVLAGIAQLVEHDLAKVGVEGPSPFSRSKKENHLQRWFSFFYRNLDEDPRRGAD